MSIADILRRLERKEMKTALRQLAIGYALGCGVAIPFAVHEGYAWHEGCGIVLIILVAFAGFFIFMSGLIRLLNK